MMSILSLGVIRQAHSHCDWRSGIVAVIFNDIGADIIAIIVRIVTLTAQCRMITITFTIYCRVTVNTLVGYLASFCGV